MSTFTLFIAAIIQGITEFLPVSSAMHLLLWERLQGVSQNGFPYDLVLNLGTLLAIVVYFRKELARMTVDWTQQCMGKGSTPYSHLAWMLILSTLPVCLVGLFFGHYIEDHLRSLAIMGVMTIIFGFLLGCADRRIQTSRELTQITIPQALVIGCAQIFALIPGASRSGTTMTAARFLGLNREVSVRYSFLMAIPATLGGAILVLHRAIESKLPFEWSLIVIGFVVSAVIGLFCIRILLELIGKIGFMPFAIYRVILGIILVMYSFNQASAKSWTDDFTGSLGAGLSYIPEYPGSTTYQVIPLPIIDVVYKQILFAAVSGVGAQFRFGDWVLGPRFSYNTGRENEGYIKHMDNLPGSIDGGVYVKYLMLPWVASFDIQTAITTAGHQGSYADLGLLYRMVWDKYWTIIPTFELMYGSANYMKAFFAVSDSEAAATGFSPYTPQWGLYSAGINLAAANSYFDPWRFVGTAGILTLGTQAGQSDVVQSQIQWSFFMGVAYHF